MSELGYLKISREADDYLEINGERIRVVRISLGGNVDIGHYCKFRGEPAEVIDLLEMALLAMRVKFGTKETPPGQGKS